MWKSTQPLPVHPAPGVDVAERTRQMKADTEWIKRGMLPRSGNCTGVTATSLGGFAFLLVGCLVIGAIFVLSVVDR